jgi:hypothetical protein
MKETLIKIANNLGLAYWVKIVTDRPNCIYYFGPFLTVRDANAAQSGYVEDLKNEGAQSIKVEIARCQPQELTIFDDRDDNSNFQPVPVFSS